MRLIVDSEQHSEIARLLRDSGIPYREVQSPSRFLGGETIVVGENDYARARDVVAAAVESHALIARSKWQAEWLGLHHSSFAHWFLHRLRTRPVATLFRLVLLVGVVGAMVIYPLVYVIRQAI